MLLDIAFGLWLGKLFSISFFEGASWVMWCGVVFALLPDIDFVFPFLKGWSHRGLIHTPFFYLVLSGMLWSIGMNWHIIVMLLIGASFHLVHDMFVLGRGVMLLFPFSNYRLKLFPDNGRDGYLKQKVLWWNESNTPLYSIPLQPQDYKTLHSESWIKMWYMRPNLFLFIETSLAIIFFFLFWFL